MCGIAGVMLGSNGEVGRLLMVMLEALQHRGLDSAGVAIFNGNGLKEDEFVIRVFTPDIVGALSKVSTAIAEAGGDIRSININPLRGYGFDRYVVRASEERVGGITERINGTDLSKVLSLGRRMDIVKDTTTVRELDRNFGISRALGSHAIGHVRFSTESSATLLNAHPFQSFEYLDAGLVHNGQITNYWKSREKLERRGVSFQTQNDSELIVHYLAQRLKAGESLREGLAASVDELDGPFSYIFSTAGEMGMVRDRLGLRPLVVFEGDGVKAAASEENALRILGRGGTIRNVRPGEVIVWSAS